MDAKQKICPVCGSPVKFEPDLANICLTATCRNAPCNGRFSVEIPERFGVLHLIMIGLVILSSLLWGVYGLAYGFLFVVVVLPMLAIALLHLPIPMGWQYEIIVFLASMRAQRPQP